MEHTPRRDPEDSVVVRSHNLVSPVVLQSPLGVLLAVDLNHQASSSAVEVGVPAEDLFLSCEAESFELAVSQSLP